MAATTKQTLRHRDRQTDRHITYKQNANCTHFNPVKPAVSSSVNSNAVWQKVAMYSMIKYHQMKSNCVNKASSLTCLITKQTTRKTDWALFILYSVDERTYRHCCDCDSTNLSFGFSSRTTGDVFSFQSSSIILSLVNHWPLNVIHLYKQYICFLNKNKDNFDRKPITITQHNEKVDFQRN